jgi:hypothetical protein
MLYFVKEIKYLVEKKIKTMIEIFIYLFYAVKYKKSAHPKKVITIKTEDINYFLIGTKQMNHIKVCHIKVYGLIRRINGLILNSDIYEYKKNASELIRHSLKYQGIKKHFEDEVPWLKTKFFTERYMKKLQGGEIIKGCENIEELAEYYNHYYNGLFEDIKRNGVKSPEHDNSIDPILVDIDKDGSYCYTVGGNHRLMMIKILNITKIPVRIRSRHQEWQLLRDELYQTGKDAFFLKYPQLKNHADLNDCYTTTNN